MVLVDFSRVELYEAGIRASTEALERAGIGPPAFHDRRVAFFGEYSPRRGVIVHVARTRLPTRTPGYAWSFPGYKADLTAFGVVAHECGHHLEHVLGYCPVMPGKRVTSYEPNAAEALAESVKLFITNPDLLRVGRPRRWAALLAAGLVPPPEMSGWETVLRSRGAHERIIAAAANWAS